MKTYWAAKDPDDYLDYSVNWATWLGSDAIESVAWTVSDGLTIEGQNNSTTVATIWLSGGEDGKEYVVKCRITTVGGRTKDKTIYIKVYEQ